MKRNMNNTTNSEEKKNGKKKYLLLLLLLIGLPICFLPFLQADALPVDNLSSSSSESSIADMEIKEPEVPLGNQTNPRTANSDSSVADSANIVVEEPTIPTAPAPATVPTTTVPTETPVEQTAPETVPGDLTQVNTPTVNPIVNTPAADTTNNTTVGTTTTIVPPAVNPAEPEQPEVEEPEQPEENEEPEQPEEPDAQTKALTSLDWLYNQLNSEGTYLHSIFNAKNESNSGDRAGMYNKDKGQVDSTGPNDAPIINGQMQEAGCTVGSWRIYKEKANQDHYNIFWTENDIQAMENGDTIDDVYRMSNYQDENNQKLTEEETQVTVGSSEVVEKKDVSTSEGDKVDINTISGGAYTIENVVETEPTVEE